jgi:hypothetical protein
MNDYKKIWNNKKVVFVYSKEGRFDAKHELFSNIKESKHIDIPPKNAFQKYDETLLAAKKYSTDWLFLIAGGPAASVLAYDLAVAGYQAIDIGHLPNCYDELTKKAPPPRKTAACKKS